MSNNVDARIKSIREVTARIVARNSQGLAQIGRLGEAYSFEEAVPIFESMLTLFRRVSECTFDDAPADILVKIQSLALGVDGVFDEIESFQATVPQPANTHAALLKKLSGLFYQSYSYIVPIVTHESVKGIGVDRIVSELHTAQQDAKSVRDNLGELAEKTRLEVQEIVSAARAAAGEIGFAEYATYFKDEAASHRLHSRFWLTVVVLLICSIAASAYWSFGLLAEVLSGDSVSRSIQFGISKLVFFSVAYYALVLCARNYKAHRHNHVINRHRFNAVRTFQAFSSTATDEATKNAVLLRATEAVFDAGSSGYLSKLGDQKGPPQIMELIRHVTSRGD